MKRKPKDKYLNQTREVPQEVNDKFIIDGQKVKIHVKNIKEIEELIEYLDFDFVYHQSQKNPSRTYIQDTEFIVSCKSNRSIVAEYKSDGMAAMFNQYSGKESYNMEDALPLEVFFNPDKSPEYFI